MGSSERTGALYLFNVQVLSGSTWGALGAFDSDPLLGAVLLPPYLGAPHPSAQGGRASGPDASDLSRLRAWAPLGHPGRGSWGSAGVSWAELRPLGPCEGPLLLQFDQALLGPELASDTHQTKRLFERPGSEELGFLRPEFCGTLQRPKSSELWALPGLCYCYVTDVVVVIGPRVFSFCVSLLSSESPPSCFLPRPLQGTCLGSYYPRVTEV